MIKHVFTDVDLTFIGEDQKVKAENLNALKKLKEKGIDFSFCSGRLIIALEDLLNQVGLNNNNEEYQVCGNGAIVCSSDGRTLYSNPINEETMKKMLDYFYSLKGSTFNIVSDTMYYFNYTPASEKLINYPKRELSKEEMYEVIKKEKIYKLVYFVEDQNEVSKTKEEIDKITDGTIIGVLSSSAYLEFGHKNSHKGYGIKKFCELKNIALSDVLAIGDNFNDETMLGISGHSACPANAVEDIKNKVEYVSNKTCDECAFADIIDHYINN